MGNQIQTNKQQLIKSQKNCLPKMSNVLEYTPVDDIPSIVTSLHKSFRANPNRSLEYRLNQLRNLYYAIKDNEELLVKALKKDLNRPEGDTQLLEITPLYIEILTTINNLSKWMKPTSAKNVDLLYYFTSPKIAKIPLGTVLIIGPFNFPYLTTLAPLVGSIAAGNTTVFKQSEQIPYTSQTLGTILTDALDPEIFQIVQGGIEETTALLKQKFDKIIYTGSGKVGRIIASKAAETLTPTILELGGKSPAFVTPSVQLKDLKTVCKRIAFTRFANAGQTCVSTDYCIVHDSLYDEFVDMMKLVIKELYDVDETNSTKLVNKNAWDRVMNIIRNTKSDVVLGGDGDREARFIQPTLLTNVSFDDASMKEEIFGPVLPVIRYSDLQHSIDNVLDIADTPLALYIYSKSSKEIETISSQIRSGALVVNDGVIHGGLACVPFGGVGESGYGSYHGKWSFDAFSHERAVLKNPFWTDILFESKYPPITKMDLKLSKFFLVPRKSFKRTGRVRANKYEFFIKVLFVGVVGVAVGYYNS